MCSQCDEADIKIRHLRDVARRMLDQQALDGIADLVKELEAEKAARHPE
jgi:hypothetical protein